MREKLAAKGIRSEALTSKPNNGLPQGLSISPVLSVLAMEYTLNKVIVDNVKYFENVITFIDDGILFSNEPINHYNHKNLKFLKQYDGTIEFLNPLEIEEYRPTELLSIVLGETGSKINKNKSHLFREQVYSFAVYPVGGLTLLSLLLFGLFGIALIPFIIMWFDSQIKWTYKTKQRNDSLVFCGIEYNSITNTLKGRTRSGSILEFLCHDTSKLQKLVMEGYYPKDYNNLSNEELAVQLEVLNPILSIIYNNGETYVDELRHGRSALYGLPPTTMMDILGTAVSASQYGVCTHSIMVLEREIAQKISDIKILNEYNASSAASLWLVSNASLIYDKHKLARRYSKTIMNLYQKHRNIRKARAIAAKIVKSYNSYNSDLKSKDKDPSNS